MASKRTRSSRLRLMGNAQQDASFTTTTKNKRVNRNDRKEENKKGGGGNREQIYAKQIKWLFKSGRRHSKVVSFSWSHFPNAYTINKLALATPPRLFGYEPTHTDDPYRQPHQRDIQSTQQQKNTKKKKHLKFVIVIFFCLLSRSLLYVNILSPLFMLAAFFIHTSRKWREGIE